MQLNRKFQPTYKNIDAIDIIHPNKIALDNGIKAHFINAGTQEVLKIDVIFEAGSWYQDRHPIASVTNEMMLEGTKNLTSRQISEKLDYYGAFIMPQPTKDFASLSLFTLKKHLPETIIIIEDIIKNPSFDQNELSTFINKKKQLFLVEMEKVSNLARRAFNEQLFGAEHPYGKNLQIEDYDQISRTDLVHFHTNHYHPKRCKIIVAGKIDDSDIKIINKHFGNKEWAKGRKIFNPEITTHDQIIIKETIIPKENVTQSAIRVGKITITKTHPDFLKLNILNTILGGYFGSRLMKNIREEKGYTYGIGSALISLKNEGFFVIVSEVGADVARNTINEIFKEIDRLREEKMSTQELNLVKNYMMGDFLRSFDGPFELSTNYRDIIDFDLTPEYFNQAIDDLKSITPEEVMKLANKYFNKENFVKTIAGKYE